MKLVGRWLTITARTPKGQIAIEEVRPNGAVGDDELVEALPPHGGAHSAADAGTAGQAAGCRRYPLRNG